VGDITIFLFVFVFLCVCLIFFEGVFVLGSIFVVVVFGGGVLSL